MRILSSIDQDSQCRLDKPFALITIYNYFHAKNRISYIGNLRCNLSTFITSHVYVHVTGLVLIAFIEKS